MIFLLNICFLLQHKHLANTQAYFQVNGCSRDLPAGLLPQCLGAGKASSPLVLRTTAWYCRRGCKHLSHPDLLPHEPKGCTPDPSTSRRLFPCQVLLLLRTAWPPRAHPFFTLPRGKYNLSAFSCSLWQLNSLIWALLGKFTSEEYLQPAPSSFIYLLYSELYRQGLIKHLSCCLCLTTAPQLDVIRAAKIKLNPN